MGQISLQSLSDLNRQRHPPHRYLHVLGVTHMATALAMRHGADPGRAAVAALLHDLSKPIPPDQIEADLAKRGLAIEPDDRPFPAVWHGIHAAALAASDYGLAEADGVAEIAEAVRLHSTADAKMGKLAKILFLADALEPTRAYDGIDELRKLARRDLDAAFLATLEHKCRHMGEKGRGLSPRAARALEFHRAERSHAS